MSPALAPGDNLLVRRCSCREVSRGDIVVIALPNAVLQEQASGLALTAPEAAKPLMIKRVVALPGDRVPSIARRATWPDLVVPNGNLVALGDHTLSLDSRQLGFIPEEAIVGVVRRPLRLTTPVGMRLVPSSRHESRPQDREDIAVDPNAVSPPGRF
jgi:type IV secretory pathway protease TraF